MINSAFTEKDLRFFKSDWGEFIIDVAEMNGEKLWQKVEEFSEKEMKSFLKNKKASEFVKDLHCRFKKDSHEWHNDECNGIPSEDDISKTICQLYNDVSKDDSQYCLTGGLVVFNNKKRDLDSVGEDYMVALEVY